MSPESQRIAIAEACGWRRVAPMADVSWGASATKDRLWMWAHQLPDYTADLNAMHDAEKVLTDYQKGTYRACLFNLCDRNGYLFATAAQRAEAFLKTLNLWQP